MKRTVLPQIFILLLIITAITGRSKAQEVQERLDEALASYRSEDLENSRFALQEALNEINKAVGREILSILPSEMDGMAKVDHADDVTGVNMGFAGLFVHRTYRDETRQASVDIISDSPMLAGVNTILTMPGFVASDDDQKRIRISGFKALLTRNEDDGGKVSWDLQVPLRSTLLTFECEGYENENQVIGMVNTIPLDRIAEISR
jgi:hypothetical protein